MQDFLHPPLGSAPVEIYEDGGGLVTEYQRKAMQYSLEGRRVEIRGSCRSACVLALSVPNVCVTDGAVVKAHYAFEADTKKPRLDITDQMLSALPVKVKSVLEKNIQPQYTPGATLTYSELRDLGISSCSRETPRIRKVEKPTESAIDQILRYFGGRRPVANR